MYLSPVLFPRAQWRVSEKFRFSGMDEYQFSSSNGAETFEEGAETMETEEGAIVAGPDETQEILRLNFIKSFRLSYLHFAFS